MIYATSTNRYSIAKDHRMDGSAQEKDGKLHFSRTVGSEAEKNAIWDALKPFPIGATTRRRHQSRSARGATAQSGTAASMGKTYTVKSGDTLSKISKEYLATRTPIWTSSTPTKINSAIRQN